MPRAMALCAAAAAAAAAVAAGQAPACYRAGERNQGAEGFPAVPYAPCCDGGQPVARPGDWGLFCPAAPSCYGPGERNQGAEGFPAVPYAPCCDGGQPVALSGEWGLFCPGANAGGSGGSGGGGNGGGGGDAGGDGNALPQGWSTVQTTGLPKPRHEATFVMGEGGKAYLLGGRRVQPVGVFDSAAASWTDASSPPEELHHFQAVYAEGLVWIPAAWTGGFPFEANAESFHVYNPSTDTWSTRTPLSADRRRGSSAVAYRAGKLYVAMGNRGGHGAHASTLPWLDVYDIASDTWSTGPDAPNARDHTGGAVVGGRFCVAGGRDGGKADFFNNNIAATNCYNFGTGEWETAPDMPTPRAGSSYGTTCDGKLMVAGGEGAGQAYSRVDVFDGSSWEAPTFLVRARHGSGVAVAADCSCGNVYVASGSGAQGGSPELTSTEVFAPYGRQC